MFAKRIGRFFRQRRYIAIWAAGLAAGFLFLSLALSPLGPLDRLNALVFDAYQTIRPRPAAGSPITVVDIDDESIGRLGQWPWPRTVLAQIIDRLAEGGAASIGLDMLLSEPDRTSPSRSLDELRRLGYAIELPPNGAVLDHDIFLSEAFGRAPVISGLALAETTKLAPPPPKAGFAFGGIDPRSYLGAYEGSVRNLPELDAAATGIGLINFPPAFDGIVREIPLVSRYRNDLYPSLAMESLRVAQGASAFLVRSTGAAGESDTGNPGMVAVKVGNYEVPSGPEGKIWVYFTADKVANVIPAWQLAALRTEPDLAAMIEGHIVLIGTSAIGLRDLVSTPFAAGVPGVLVHAEIIDQILSGTFLSRPDWALGAELALAFVLMVAVLAFLPWLPASANALVVALVLAASIAVGWMGFTRSQYLLSPILPVFACLITYGTASGIRLLVSESERRYIRTAFGHYLAPALVQQLVDNPQALVLGGENRELTLLFCDVRGFTSLSEGLGPTELTEFLNNYLTPMTDVLMSSGATIDKYMGDGIMAFWNAPIPVADHQRKACRSILRMQEALVAFNETLERKVSFGVGLNTGICCVGNLGSRQRFDYSAIGDPVNVAARVESLTKQYGLLNLVSETTAAGASDFALLEIDRVRLVGRAAPTPVFSVLGDEAHARTAEFEDLKRRHDTFLSLYRARRFEDAERSLKSLQADAPEALRALYGIFLDRVELLAWDQPPEDWDGTYTASEK